MAVKTFNHYDIEVSKQIIDTKFTEQLQKNNISYRELPLIDNRVIMYKKDGINRYALITPLSHPDDYAEAVYITSVPPMDGDWNALKLDVDGQEQGEQPKKLKSRLNLLITKALKQSPQFGKTKNIFSNPFPQVTGESKEELQYIKMYLIEKGYDVDDLLQINAPDVDTQFIKKIIQA